jgi:hypothetical protein
MKDLERRYNTEHRQNDLLNVLHRPIDIAVISSRLAHVRPTGDCPSQFGSLSSQTHPDKLPAN